MRFDDPRPRRKPSLTPMIDVVFLLLVFFMLASRFGVEQTIPLSIGGSDDAVYSGPPRLVEIAPAALKLNGAAVSEADLAAKLERLIAAPSDAIVLRGEDGATVQRVVDIAEMLSRAGFATLVLVK